MPAPRFPVWAHACRNLLQDIMESKACRTLNEPFENWNEPALVEEYLQVVQNPISMSQVSRF
jgi:hypothetical protein